MIGHGMVTSALHLAHQLLQLHGFAHVAFQFHFTRHEGSGGLQFACKHFLEVIVLHPERHIRCRWSITSSASSGSVLQVNVPFSSIRAFKKSKQS